MILYYIVTMRTDTCVLWNIRCIHDMDMLITVCICYGVFWKSVISLHMDFRIWRNIGLVCYGTVLIVYCVTRYNDNKLVWCLYDDCMVSVWCLYDVCMFIIWCRYDCLWCIYVFVCCFTYIWMSCLNVGYTCQIYLYVLLYCCHTITLYCMYYIV